MSDAQWYRWERVRTFHGDNQIEKGHCIGMDGEEKLKYCRAQCSVLLIWVLYRVFLLPLVWLYVYFLLISAT